MNNSVKEVNNILFYPGAEYDFQPLVKFEQMNFISKVIYSDYASALNRKSIEEMLDNGGFEINSYHLMHPNDFGCDNWREFWPTNENQYLRVMQHSCLPDEAYIIKYSLTSPNENKIDFLYFKAEAIRTYD